MYDTAEPSKDNNRSSAAFSNEECDRIVHGLKRETPENSAVGVLSPSQRIILICLVIVFGVSIAMAPSAVFVLLNIFIATYFLIAVCYRIFLMAMGRKTSIASPASQTHDANSSLPVITILAPLYRDADSLPGLSRAIGALDYPHGKKDVKILIESDDPETIAKAERLNLCDRYDVVVVPRVGPRTKPKACNFGLLRARGELIVIYDAEDQPETDQLHKAAAAFANGDRDLACVQARLNYYNARENWLTRLFTLEYSLWFDWLLPALQKLDAPIPLGGTSNFFRTDILRKVGGWDSYNVTEDADLGLRLAKLGFRVEMLDSTTFEEANCRLGNWVRQRSRWIKGHLQTWLVHMRRPQTFVRETGWHGLLSIQLFLAGNVASALINPLLWIMFVIVNGFGLTVLKTTTPYELHILNTAALVIGNLGFVLCAVIAPAKRGWRDLCLYGLTAPAYWMLTSIAAYKALWQIFFRPYYWEKTDHMISAMTPRRKHALAQDALAQ